ncbi:TolB family protein [Cryptosporangium sp. NPDC051539]|uniref:TolB family protein n=1 Tax=Cryptosporangium sp. NPDC051539 TaxID=3363962 RepID=UPI0037873CB7
MITTALKATTTVGTAFVGAALALTSPALAASAHAAEPDTHPAGSTWTAKPDGRMLVDNGADMDQLSSAGKQTLLAGDAYERKYGSYSKDGRKIVYSDQGSKGFGAQIWSMSADGNDRRQLTHLDTEAFGPELSPSGKRIAFQTQGAIWVMNADGTNARKVSKDGFYYGAGISWAPDSNRLAVTRGQIDERSGEPYQLEIVEMRADGSNETALTSSGGDKNSPAWSPDGSTIVFSYTSAKAMQQGDTYDLWTMKADGSRLKQLTSTKNVSEQDTVWAPTGSAIAYASWAQQTETTPHVMKSKADGTSVTSLNAIGYPTAWS